MKTLLCLLSLLVCFGFEQNSDPNPEICFEPEEQKLYALIMAYRKELGLESISPSAKLTKVAQVHARDLSENFSPGNGKCNLHSWSKKGKWKACCYTDDHAEAECMWNKPMEIAAYASKGYEISYYSSAGANAAEGIAGWKLSHGHNEVITNAGIWKRVKWNAIGIGVYKEYGVVWFGEVEDTTACEKR